MYISRACNFRNFRELRKIAKLNTREFFKMAHHRSHQARLRPSMRVDGRKRAQNRTVLDFKRVYVRRRTSTSDNVVLINGQIKRVDAHRRSSTRIARRSSTSIDARRATDVDALGVNGP